LLISRCSRRLSQLTSNNNTLKNFRRNVFTQAYYHTTGHFDFQRRGPGVNDVQSNQAGAGESLWGTLL
jgi:hypothetical protein